MSTAIVEQSLGIVFCDLQFRVLQAAFGDCRAGNAGEAADGEDNHFHDVLSCSQSLEQQGRPSLVSYCFKGASFFFV
jgi:hypothetical protein